MKRVRIIKKQHQARGYGQDMSSDSNVSDLDKPISQETVKKLPTKISDNGFISFVKKTKPTEDGMEIETQEPLIIDAMGHKVNTQNIKGRCDVCKEYSSEITNCYVSGCKACLCLRHCYFFQHDDKQRPYCLLHYRQVVEEFDTWQPRKENQEKKRNEKQ